METVRFTPGPWEFERPTYAGGERIVVGAYGFGSIAAISLNGAPRSQSRLASDSPYYQAQISTMEANAQLISAAPDQNAALELVLPFLLEEQQVLERCYLPEPDEEESAGLERIALLIKVVSESLAKADGKAGA